MNYILSKISQLKKRIDFVKYCFPKGDDERFVRNVKNIGKESNLVYIENYGDKMQDSVIYHIKTEYSGSGFFADHNRLLGFLYFADRLGMKPVVEYHPDYCYAEKHPVNGTTNPFEYYFKQPTEISLEELYKCNAVVRSRKENINDAILLNEDTNGYSRNDKYIEEMGRITRKYLKLRDQVGEYISDSMNKIFSSEDRVLGIHFRGTDFKRNYNGHPVNLTIEDYIVRINELIKNYDKIFLATDDLSAVAKMKEFYGEKVVYYSDVVRSDDQETVMNSVSNRENHHYMLGLEVLRDMLTLSRCDGLVAGLSQVSIAARIQKASYEKEYEDLIIIDKGINYHQKFNCPN